MRRTWDQLDREIQAYIQLEKMEREIRRRIRRREIRKRILPVLWAVGAGASLVWLAWTIWG